MNITQETRLESFQMVLTDLVDRHQAVLNALGDQELAGFEIAAILGLETYLVLPRLKELRDVRKVEVLDATRFNAKTNRNVSVYRRING